MSMQEMAPKKAKHPKKSAAYYQANPKARAKKNAAQRKGTKRKPLKNTVLNCWLLVEKIGMKGKGGKTTATQKKEL